MALTARCSSCGAPIEWAETRAGRRMPLDPGVPERQGNIEVLGTVTDGTPLVAVATDGRRRELSAEELAALRRSHFETCPNAAGHRRRR